MHRVCGDTRIGGHPPRRAKAPARAEWRVLDGLLAAIAQESLWAQAPARRPHAVRAESTAPNTKDGHGGESPQMFFSVMGGEVQDAFCPDEAFTIGSREHGKFKLRFPRVRSVDIL
jgi:hypothetical protein